MIVGISLYGGLAGAGSGVLSALRSEGIEVDMLSVSGLCAPAAACYAAGMTMEEAFEMGSILRSLMLSNTNRNRFSIHKNTHRIEVYLKYCMEQYGIYKTDDFQKPLVFLSTDLFTGNPVIIGPSGIAGGKEFRVIRSMPAVAAIRAAMAQPGWLPPYRYENYLLYSSGLWTGIPAWPLRSLGADRVIGVNAGCSVADGIAAEHPVESAVNYAGQKVLQNEKITVDYLLNVDTAGANEEAFWIEEKAVSRNLYPIVDSLYFKH